MIYDQKIKWHKTRAQNMRIHAKRNDLYLKWWKELQGSKNDLSEVL